MPMPVSMKSSRMSRRRTFLPLIRYSLRPSEYRRRVTSTTSWSTGRARCRTRPRRTCAEPSASPSSASWSSSIVSIAGAVGATSTVRSSTGLSKVSVTLAQPRGLRVALPAKMTSIIAEPRRLLALRSPSTHLMASTTLLLPQPLGPTMPMTGASKVNSVVSAKLLKPLRVSLARRIFRTSCHRADPSMGPAAHGTRQPLASTGHSIA